MTRKLKRSTEYELTLEIKDDAFIGTPRPAQRHALLNQFMKEAALNLGALHDLASRLAPGGDRHHPVDMHTAELTDEQIMEDWQLPLMREMATIATASGGDVLEVGFGRGVSAAMIQDLGVNSHTIIECNDFVVERFHRWKESHPGRDIRLAHGLWQDVIASLPVYDAIFFHTYALDEDESIDLLARNVTFAAHFFPVAAEHLAEGGVLTYLTNEVDSLSRPHQRLLFEHFRSFRLHLVPLDVPHDVKDAWWADSMAVIEATK